MVREAQLRIQHNRQRLRLKQLLNTAADGGPTVKTNDLLLACQLAKMPMDSARVLTTPFAMDRNSRGFAKNVVWKGFHESLEYPVLHGHGGLGELPPLRSARKHHMAIDDVMDTLTAEPDAPKKAQVSDEVVYFHWSELKRLMETRFAEMRRAFRLIDEDASGACDRGELKFMLNAMFNLTIPDAVLDRIIDLADYDGDNQINFAEFCRLMTADNVLDMKKTLTADDSAWGTKAPEKKISVNYSDVAEQNRKMAAGGYEGGVQHVKLRRSGPSIDALRRAHQTLKKAILARYGTIMAAFKEIDKDGSGTLRRGELKTFMRALSKSVPDRVIGALIDFCDSDGDAKSLSIEEFCGMMEASHLGAGGYDPSAPVLGKK